MGFSGEEAEQALFRTGNKGVTDACEYIMDEMMKCQPIEGPNAGAGGGTALGADGLPSASPTLQTAMTEPMRPSTMSPLLGPDTDGA